MTVMAAAWRARPGVWPLRAGVVLVILALLAYFIVVRPMRSEIVRLTAEEQQLQSQIKRRLRVNPPAPPPPEVREDLGAGYRERLRSVYLQFMPIADIAAALSAMNEAAAQGGLRLQSGDYRLEPVPSTNLVRYRINVSLLATLPQIQAFVERVTSTLPVTSLTEAAMKRARADDARFDARLGFTIYLVAERPNSP